MKQPTMDQLIRLLRECQPFLVHARCTIPDDARDYLEAGRLLRIINPIAFPEVERAFQIMKTKKKKPTKKKAIKATGKQTKAGLTHGIHCKGGVALP